MSKLNEIADYAEDHDLAAEMEQGTWEAGTDADPMITTSVRLPKSLLDWIRQRAAAQHVRPSVLIRQWIEQQRDEDGTETAGGCVLSRARVSRFARLVAWCLVHNPGTEQADGLIGSESALTGNFAYRFRNRRYLSQISSTARTLEPWRTSGSRSIRIG